MRRRGAASIAANPVLIGAATTLVVIVAVFLAYNANRGLPFVPTYDVKVELPNASNLVKGNEVRIGGTRVGVIQEIKPRQRRDGSTTAIMDLKLEKAVEPLPRDTTIIVRPKSALGLKYLSISRGNDRAGFPAGATIPLANQKPEQVEIDEVINMFDEPTRAANRTNLDEFGIALAGRGQNINLALQELPTLLRNLEPVMKNLSDRRTGLDRFFRGLGQAAAEAAPVAETQAALFRNLDTTFAAIADVAPDLQETISSGPPALEAGIRSFPVQRPFLRNTQALFRELRPGVRALRTAAPPLADAFRFGRGSLRRSVELNERLKGTFRAVERFSRDPMTSLGINGLRNLTRIATPTVQDLEPVQTVCNYMTLWFRNVASLLSEGDSNGTWQRFIVVSSPTGPNNEGGPSNAPANGSPAAQRQVNSPPGGPPNGNFLHTNPYPNSPGGGRPNECEGGNEPYIVGRKVVGNVQGNQGLRTEKTTIQQGGTQGG